MAPWLKALALWFAILVLAIVNGALREKALVPALGESAGLVASGIVLSACILLVAWAGAPWFGPLASHQCVLIGAFWLLLTVVFEFGFGRIARDKTWPELLEAYTFKGGNIWPLVLLVTLVAPWLAARVRGLV
ncbi:MAG TPA: hypothetical protein VF384_05220 [Planctomycetota bacterium]